MNKHFTPRSSLLLFHVPFLSRQWANAGCSINEEKTATVESCVPFTELHVGDLRWPSVHRALFVFWRQHVQLCGLMAVIISFECVLNEIDLALVVFWVLCVLLLLRSDYDTSCWLSVLTAIRVAMTAFGLRYIMLVKCSDSDTCCYDCVRTTIHHVG